MQSLVEWFTLSSRQPFGVEKNNKNCDEKELLHLEKYQTHGRHERKKKKNSRLFSSSLFFYDNFEEGYAVEGFHIIIFLVMNSSGK